MPTATYSRLFPQRVRAAYFDGTPSHPDAPNIGNDGQDPNERAFSRFAKWCAVNKECALHGEDAEKVWQKLVEEADRRSVPVESKESGETAVTGAQLHVGGLSMVSFPGPGKSGWRAFADAINRARNGDPPAFAETALQTLRLWGTPSAIARQCPDGLYGEPGYTRFRRAWEAAKRAKPNFYGTGLLPLACSGWPLPVANPPAPLPGEKLPPFLGAGTWTDYGITKQLVRHVPGSATIRYDGPGHVLYTTGHRCVIAHVERYIAELKLPPDGTVCKPGQ